MIYQIGLIKQAKENAEKYDGTLKITHSMEEAYKDADIVIPKNWGKLGD